MTSTIANTPQEEGSSALHDWREEVFLKIIRVIGIAGTFAYVIGIALDYENLFANLGVISLYTTAYLLIMIAAFAPRIPTVYRTYMFATVIAFIGVLASAEKAAVGDGRIWLLLAIFLAAVFLGRSAGLVYVVLTSLAWALIGSFFTSSILPQPSIEQFSFGIWGGTTVTLFVVGVITVLIVNALSINLSESVDNKAALIKISEEQGEELRKQHIALERRSETLEATSSIIRKLTRLAKYDDILMKMPSLIRESFSLNSAAIFLLDAENSLYLASSSEWNVQDKNKLDLSLSINDDVLGAAIMEDDAYSDKDSNFALKVELESTNAYVVFPLRGREKRLGALVLQSDDEDAFGEERINILKNFVEQTVLLLENANLLEQREKALNAERRAYGQITQSAWSEFIENQEFGSYRRDSNGLSALPAKEFEKLDEDGLEREYVPIQIRGKIIGYVDAHKSKNRVWTASEKELLRILTARLETAIDSARLYQDTQERAERDRIIGETSTRLRESLDIESVLKTAASELQKKLGIAEAEVWLDAGYLEDADTKSNGEKNTEEEA